MVVHLAGSGVAAQAANTRQTVNWQEYEDKNVLTDKVTHRVAGQVIFSDGNLIQVYAKCAEDNVGAQWPGMTLVVGAFDTAKTPKPFAWQKSTVELPVVLNDRQHSVRVATENPRANLVAVGFYDPAAAKRFTHINFPPLMQIEQFKPAAEIKQQAAWSNFVAGTAGTLSDFVQASSIRVQLPLSDGSADVLDINPQDDWLKGYAQRCNAQFQTHPR